MSLLLKTDPLVTGLSLYDIRGAPGVAADISHVNTHSVVKGFEKDEWVWAVVVQDEADLVVSRRLWLVLSSSSSPLVSPESPVWREYPSSMSWDFADVLLAETIFSYV
jgi:hypothetical protein